MSEMCKSSAVGVEMISQCFIFPATKLAQNIDFSLGATEHDMLYCVTSDAKLKLFDEKLLREVFSHKKMKEPICLLDDGGIFYGTDHKSYRYSVASNSIKKLSVEKFGSCPYGNSNFESEFMIVQGKDPDDDSRWGDKKVIYKLLKQPFSVEWKVQAPCDGIFKFLIDNSGAVFYSITNKARVYCHSLSSGTVLWEKDVAPYIESESKMLGVHPVLTENSIVLAYESETIAISTENADLLWRNPGKGAGRGIISNEFKFYQLGYADFKKDRFRSLLVTDVKTGDVLTSYNLKSDDPDVSIQLDRAMPMHWVISTTHIIVGWGNGYVTAINPENGHIDWYVDLGDTIMPGMMISNNRLYCRTARSDVNDRVMKSYVFEGEGGFGAV